MFSFTVLFNSSLLFSSVSCRSVASNFISLSLTCHRVELVVGSRTTVFTLLHAGGRLWACSADSLCRGQHLKHLFLWKNCCSIMYGWTVNWVLRCSLWWSTTELHLVSMVVFYPFKSAWIGGARVISVLLVYPHRETWSCVMIPSCAELVKWTCWHHSMPKLQANACVEHEVNFWESGIQLTKSVERRFDDGSRPDETLGSGNSWLETPPY